MGLKVIICYIKALKEFFRHGIFVPHVYRDISAKRTIIISTDTGFRVSRDWGHEPRETVHPNAILVTSKCTCCGKESHRWYRESWRYNKEDLWDTEDYS